MSASGKQPARTWRLLRSGFGRPRYNLSCDEALLRSPEERPALRLYGWLPAALSLGYFQPREAFEQRAAEAQVEIVRRQTGGGAIHHADELTFCLVATPGRDGYPAETVAGYECVHAVVRNALSGLGAKLDFRGGEAPLSVHPRKASMCFDDHTALDLVDSSGRKVVGSAQRRAGGRVLHHGSIPLSVPSLSPDVGSVELAAGRRVEWGELADALTANFRASLCVGGLESAELSESEAAVAKSEFLG